MPVSWVYAECRAGRLPHVKLGKYTRVRREALDAWVAALEAGSLKGPGGATPRCCRAPNREVLRMVEPFAASWFYGWFYRAPLGDSPRPPRRLVLAARHARGGGQRAGSTR